MNLTWVEIINRYWLALLITRFAITIGITLSPVNAHDIRDFAQAPHQVCQVDTVFDLHGEIQISVSAAIRFFHAHVIDIGTGIGDA